MLHQFANWFAMTHTERYQANTHARRIATTCARNSCRPCRPRIGCGHCPPIPSDQSLPCERGGAPQGRRGCSVQPQIRAELASWIAKGKRIATPVCGLVRNDSLVTTPSEYSSVANTNHLCTHCLPALPGWLAMTDGYRNLECHCEAAEQPWQSVLLK